MRALASLALLASLAGCQLALGDYKVACDVADARIQECTAVPTANGSCGLNDCQATCVADADCQEVKELVVNENPTGKVADCLNRCGQ
jgi:uncharacterized low-complexity protein